VVDHLRGGSGPPPGGGGSSRGGVWTPPWRWSSYFRWPPSLEATCASSCLQSCPVVVAGSVVGARDNRSMAQWYHTTKRTAAQFNGQNAQLRNSMDLNDDGGSMGCGTSHRGDALASGRERRTARVRCCPQLNVCELRYVMIATRASPGMG
jgi:hypothetical protein